MDVRYLMLARHAELAPDGAANLIGAGSYLRYDMATPTVLPMLYIATQLTMTVEEAAAPHAIEFRVLGPRGEQIAESDPINLPPQYPTSEDSGKPWGCRVFGNAKYFFVVGWPLSVLAPCRRKSVERRTTEDR